MRHLLLLSAHGATCVVQYDALAVSSGPRSSRIQRQLNVVVYDELLLLLRMISLRHIRANVVDSIAHGGISATRQKWRRHCRVAV